MPRVISYPSFGSRSLVYIWKTVRRNTVFHGLDSLAIETAWASVVPIVGLVTRAVGCRVECNGRRESAGLYLRARFELILIF